jgi:protocatechuate 3,4-dioxygenase beta subunit
MERFTRRASLHRFAGMAASVGGLGLAEASAASGGPTAVSRGLVGCVLTPELTEGPYYVPGEKLRHDVTEGKPGTPLKLNLRVLDVSHCTAIAGATVEIWHCDAIGVYSGAIAGSPGTNFLRGGQRTNTHGVASFATIYPGWYPGRAVHIHVKVHVGGAVVHTGQLFFPAVVTDAVYTRAPYRSHGTHPDTANAADAIYRNGGNRGLLALKQTGKGYTAWITMGVHRS